MIDLPILDCLNPPCGACCLHMGMPPFDCYDDDDIEFVGLPDELKRELEQVWDSHFGDQKEKFEGRISNNTGGACAWLDLETRKCRHYEHRPAICRNFEPGCDVCQEDREIAERDGMLTP